jgi:hypothetical protein
MSAVQAREEKRACNCVYLATGKVKVVVKHDQLAELEK